MKNLALGRKRKIIISGLLMLIFLAGLFNLVNLTRHSSASRRIGFSKGWNVSFDGKIYENVDLESFRLPRSIKRGEFLTLSTELPWDLPKGNAIIIPVTLSTISVEVDHKIVYGYGSKEFANGKMVGSAVHVIRIPDNSQGDSLSVVIRAGENGAFSYISGVVLEGMTWGFTDYINHNIYPVIISISLVMGGIVLIIISLFLALKGKSFSKILNTGVLLFTVGCWNICVIYAIQLFSLDFEWNTFSRYLFGYLSIIPAVSIMSDAIVEGREKEKFIQNIILAVDIVVIAAVIFLSAINKIHICNVRCFIQIMGVVSLVAAALLELRKCKDQEFFYTSKFSEGVFFFIILAAETVRYILYKRYNFKLPVLRHSLLLYGTLILMMMMLGSYIYELYVEYLRQAEENTLKKLAFTDGLTGLLNRTYCKERMEELDNGEKDYHMISFDVDDLKKINDSRGHHEGDRLLRAFGDILTKCFSDVGDVIRPGGDEFLIISDDASDQELLSRLTWLPDLEKEAGRTLGFPVTAAYGLAGSTEVQDCSTEKVYNLADKRMYEMKISSKKR